MNQFRKSIKYSLLTKVRSLICKFTLGKVGENLYLEKNIQFLRNKKNIFLHDNVAIKEGARIACCNKDAKIIIGDNTTIGYNTFIFSSKSIEIGKNCMISSFAYLVDSTHGIKKGVNMNEQKEKTSKIIIGNDVWLGQGSTILQGVEIGDGSIIGAGSVVNQSIDSNKIYAGNPAREIGNRDL